MKKLAVLFLTLCSISTSSHAYDGWVGAGKITSIRQQQTLTLIQMTNTSNPGKCTETQYIMFRNDTAHADRFNATLMMAFASDKVVQLAVTGCAPWPVITEILVVK
ncbi:MAG: hypothetical protein HRT35_16590 [Algicola sp.]|nr:hypothetical protein [Algicola sp.]